ncbi:MAG TPA: carboxypeptidase-like regulatory domain-containing protein [Bacteroidia bacterium]|nr:carboxypeptidase-like regulatory domain-containing protein [Bacteroidia bacterium]
MKRFTLLAVVVISLLQVACRRNKNYDPTPVTGSITGKILLTDEFGGLLPVHSGMKITAVFGDSTLSSDSGNYSITELDEGAYLLKYEKPGFGTFKKFSIPVRPQTGDGTTVLSGVDYLGQISTTQISSLSVTVHVPDSSIDIACVIGPNPGPASPRNFRLFFSSDTNVSSGNYEYTPANTWTATTASGAVLGFDAAVLYSHGMAKGTTAHVVGYGESARTNTYFDPVLNTQVYPNLNTISPSNVVSFIVP